MKVSEVSITPIKATDSLVAFASCVLDEQLFIGSIGVHSRLDGAGYRITYPVKQVGNRQINLYHPITKQAGIVIEQAIIAKCTELFERSDEHYGRYSKITPTSN